MPRMFLSGERGRTAAGPGGRAAAAAAAAALSCVSCTPVDVNLATSEPIKVDVAVRLDVYQYSKEQDGENKAGAAGGGAGSTAADTVDIVRTRQRNRSGEVQTLKNNRFVGENHRALLTLREQPTGRDGEWVKKVVQGENDDRMFLMVEMAKSENLQLHEVQVREWRLNLERAFPGEWIEVPGDREGLYTWKQKQKS